MDAVLPVALLSAVALLFANFSMSRALARPQKDLQIVAEGEFRGRRYEVRHKDGVFIALYEGQKSMIPLDDRFFSVHEASDAVFFFILREEYEGSPCSPMDMPPEGFGCFEDIGSHTGFSFRMLG